uniref:DUF659 domain-containing protein n=1 Tax=Anopheles funestus TaxID=62324 RepID=A0A182RLZ5_ANOFN
RHVKRSLCHVNSKKNLPVSITPTPETAEDGASQSTNTPTPTQAQINQYFPVTSTKSLSDSVLPAIYQDSLAIVKSKFSSAIVISLTADGWTNLNNTSFYTVTAHFINNDFHLASLMLECEEFTVQHTGRNIAEWFKFVLERFEISDKIVAITTDNASNMRLAASILKLPHFSGFAHSLKLVVLNAVAKSIKPVVEEVKQTVMHFKKSVLATSKLAEIQKNLNTENIKLKQNTPTQWNSTYDMLNRFYRNNIALRMCIDSLKIICKHTI